jgi:hypothetical protein
MFKFFFLKGGKESARNYQLMDEESTGGKVILPRITSSLMRNPPEK